MTALYGRVHGFGPRQHAREAINKAADATRCAHGDDLGGGAEGEGGNDALVVAMATVHRETQRGKKQENERPIRGCGEITLDACRSTKPLLAAINCAIRSGEGP